MSSASRCSPLWVRRRVESVIELFQARRRLGEKVESQQADLLRQAQRIIRLSQGMVEALSTAIEFRSEESGGHVQRIRRITQRLLEHTPLGEGLSQEEIEQIALASIMHDVGKIAVPDAILNKPGKLTPEEFEVMKNPHHPGGKAAGPDPPVPGGQPLPLRQGHRPAPPRALGRPGLPRGPRGGTRSPSGPRSSPWRTCYDALSCKRVYKDAFSREKVLEMICGGQCGTFNPRLLECFLAEEPALARLYQREE